MPIESASNAADLPKILLVEEKTACTLMFQEQEIVKSKVAVENKDGKTVRWSRYDIADMTVYDEDGDEVEEGTNDIPFYGMAAFEECYNKLTKAQLKGDIIFSFRRVKSGTKNQFKFEVDL